MLPTPPQKKAIPPPFSPTTGTHSRNKRTPVECNSIDIQMGLPGKQPFMHKNARFQFLLKTARFPSKTVENTTSSTFTLRTGPNWHDQRTPTEYRCYAH